MIGFPLHGYRDVSASRTDRVWSCKPGPAVWTERRWPGMMSILGITATIVITVAITVKIRVKRIKRRSK